MFAKLGIKSDFTFQSLFKLATAKKVLLHYLDELKSKRLALLDFKAKNDEALLVALCVNNPELGAKQILQLFGLKKAMEFMTPRELRVLFTRFYSRGWRRIMAYAKNVKLPIANSPFRAVREQVVKFRACKI